MVEVMPLRPQDRARWEVLARGYKAFYRTEVSDAGYEEAWRRLNGNEGLFGLGAHLDGRLVGITHYLFHKSVWMGDVCYLQDLFVDNEMRGTGLGRVLIEAVKREAGKLGVTNVYWMTHETNATARQLYDRVARRTGFIEYDLLPGKA